MNNPSQSTITSNITSPPQIHPLIKSQSTQNNFKIMEKNIKLIKSPTIAIQPVTSIDDWISRNKSQKMRQNLTKTLKTNNALKYLRKVRGDGNCFIRALAFQYLIQKANPKLDECFPFLNIVVLTCSEKEFIPKKFLPFYDSEFLSYCLKQNWQVQYQKSLNQHFYNHKLALASLLAQNPYLDFIIVLYMRALSVLALRKFQNNPQIAGFLQNNDEDKLRNYGNLSDGLTQFLLSKILLIEMKVYEIRKQEILTYFYPIEDDKNNATVHLRFQLNHYDLLEVQADIAAQIMTPSLQRSDSYYSNQNYDFIEGRCLNCQQFIPIHIQSCLCQGCFQQTKTALDNFSKTKIVLNPAESYHEVQNGSTRQGVFKKLSGKLPENKSVQKKHRKQKKGGIFGCFR